MTAGTAGTGTAETGTAGTAFTAGTAGTAACKARQDELLAVEYCHYCNNDLSDHRWRWCWLDWLGNTSDSGREGSEERRSRREPRGGVGVGLVVKGGPVHTVESVRVRLS